MAVQAPEKILEVLDKFAKLDPSQLARMTHPIQRVMRAARDRIAADSAWPALSEELARKATEAAHEALHRLSAGEIDRAAATAALRAVLDTTQGLIGNDVFDILNQAYREVQK